MKKYIIVAIVSLLCFSSCVVGNGGVRSRIDYGKEILARQVVGALLPVEWYPQFAIYGEALLSGAQGDAEFIKNHYFSGARIFEEDTTILLFVGNDRYTQYEIRTDGKRLSEGGVWQLVEVLGSEKVEELCSIEGVAGEAQCFKMYYEDFQYSYYYDYAPCDIYINIKYTVDMENESVALDVTGGGVIGVENQYATTFDIDTEQPLLYVKDAESAGYVDGKICAEYEDFEYENTESIVITYDLSGKYSYE